MKLSTLINTVNTVRTDGIQKAINNLSDGYIDPDFFPAVVTKYGDLYNRAHVNDITNTFDHYPSIKSITKNDIVLDIGAFIGGFTIPAAKRAKSVLAIEPLYSQELTDNLRLNSLTNVSVIRAGLGAETGFKTLSYFREENTKIITFKNIRDIMAEPPTYLKCNCEGGEWSLQPEDFTGINTVEIQFHDSKNLVTNPELLQWLRDNYVSTETTNDTTGVNGIYRIRDFHGKR